jgi:NAD-dependent isocitrate dehydrogenase
MSDSPRTITLIKGDGIGPEIADAVCEIFDAAQVPVRFEEAYAGLACLEARGEALPRATLDSVHRNRVALKGPTTTPIGGGHKSVNVAIRKSLDLFANVRPCRSMPGIKTRFENVDLIIVRENIEDTYGGIEHMQSPDVAQCLRLITRPGSLAIARYAFDMARREGRKRVTCVQKANIMKMTDGLFLECFRHVAKDYPDLHADEILIDNCCMQLVVHPSRFDVLVTPNLFGDILSDLCAGLVGGLGVAPGGNIGDDKAVFEAVHGSAPDIAGKGLANPTALLLSAVQMLRYLGLLSHARRIEQGLRFAFVEGIRTRDLGGGANTREFARAIIHGLPPAGTDATPVSHPSGTGVSPVSPSAPSSSPSTPRDPWTLKGLDIFIHHDGLPPVPPTLGKFRLAFISNRGQKVGPVPAGAAPPTITLVNIHACRYLADQPPTNDDLNAFLAEFSKRFNWVHIEKLHESAGHTRYSKSAGE